MNAGSEGGRRDAGLDVRRSWTPLRAVAARGTVFVLPLLAGCAGSPPPVEVPLDWSPPTSYSARDTVGAPASSEDSTSIRTTAGVETDATRSVSPQWWRGFEDPTLDELVQEGLAHNHDLRAAAGRVEIAHAQARIVGADLYPSLNLSGDASRRRQNFIGLAIPGSGGVLTSTSNSFSASAVSNWEIDLWGRIRSAGSAAAGRFEAARADYAGARLSLAGLVAKSWFGLIEARQQVELAEATVESYRESVDQVRDRFELGVRTSLDLRGALAQLAQAEALLQARRQALDARTRQLEVVLGRYPRAELEASVSLPALESDVPSGLPAQLLERRPDLVAAERRLAAADREVASAKRSLLPSISLTGTAGRSSNELEDLLDNDFSIWSIAGNLLQPIFQGGRLRANVSLQRANLEVAAEQYASAALTAFAEVESRLAAQSFLAERERSLAEAAEQASAARVLAEERYASGLVDYITVLDAQRTSLNVESQLLETRRDRVNARVDLILALGGGYGGAERRGETES